MLRLAVFALEFEDPGPPAAAGRNILVDIQLSVDLIAPWFDPDESGASGTATAWAFTSSVRVVGDDLGRRDLGSSTAAWPSSRARFLSS